MAENHNTLITGIVSYIRNNPDGVSSQVLAETFLKFKNPDEHMAHIAVSGILSRGSGCQCNANGLWSVTQPGTDQVNVPLEKVPWAVVYFLTSPVREDLVLHVSLWTPFASPQCLFSGWLTDPQTLSYEEQELLRSEYDSPYHSRAETQSHFITACTGRTVLFFSSRHQRIMARFCMMLGESIPDDTLLFSQLCRITGCPIPKTLKLRHWYTRLLNRKPVLHAAYHYGEAFCACVRAVFAKLIDQGVTTREDLDRYELKETCAAVWDSADFTLEDITALSGEPGVYGFKNRDGEFIYIGKAANLKRRILCYYRDTGESPEKLKQLRKEAHTLMVSQCGSELESLILEYRLLKKYRPRLNSRFDINERNGDFAPLQDCIILLPHAEKDKGMSFWFKKEQKILMKPFYTDFREMDALCEAIDSFFLQETLPTHATDFPEQELAYRWVKKNRERIPIIPVYRLSSSEEIGRAMQTAWHEK